MKIRPRPCGRAGIETVVVRDGVLVCWVVITAQAFEYSNTLYQREVKILHVVLFTPRRATGQFDSTSITWVSGQKRVKP